MYVDIYIDPLYENLSKEHKTFAPYCGPFLNMLG